MQLREVLVRLPRQPLDVQGLVQLLLDFGFRNFDRVRVCLDRFSQGGLVGASVFPSLGSDSDELAFENCHWILLNVSEHFPESESLIEESLDLLSLGWRGYMHVLRLVGFKDAIEEIAHWDRRLSRRWY